MKKLLLTVQVDCGEPLSVRGSEKEVVMVPFCGYAYGEDFNGKVMGTGVDTQKYSLSGGEKTLSARYILEGKDKTGTQCRIFIENELRNNGCWQPCIVTDSKYLIEWEKIPLAATVDVAGSGVCVKIYAQDLS